MSKGVASQGGANGAASAEGLRADAEARYRAAVARRAQIEREWGELGSPTTALGGATGRALVPHPMVRMLQEADTLCDRLAQALTRRAAPGRPPGAVSAPDRKAPPRVKLRKVS